MDPRHQNILGHGRHTARKDAFTRGAHLQLVQLAPQHTNDGVQLRVGGVVCLQLSVHLEEGRRAQTVVSEEVGKVTHEVSGPKGYKPMAKYSYKHTLPSAT